MCIVERRIEHVFYLHIVSGNVLFIACTCSPQIEGGEEKPSIERSLDDVLKEHVAQNVFHAEIGDEQLVPVRRQELWRDVLRCINAPGFVQDRGLRIRFLGEEAVDAGGPLR